MNLRLSFLAMVLMCLSGGASANPVMRLKVVGSTGPYSPGDEITVALSMAQLGSNQAAGFQAFLEFNTEALEFIDGHYTAVPFGVPIISPIEGDGANLDLASGINIFIGQGPTSADSTLAFLNFEVLQPTCRVIDLEFRSHDPPTRLTDAAGNEILPLDLVSLSTIPCPGDVLTSGVVGVQDLLYIIQNWGPCPVVGDCCADTDGDNAVGVPDLLAVIINWGPCP